MRHRVSGVRLGRNSGQRNALLRNLSSDLLQKGYIVTTLTKAKLAQSYIEKNITQAKRNSIHSTRRLSSTLSDKAFSRLINEVAPGFSQRQSGYTRITRLGNRKGDAAPTVKLELLTFDKHQVSQKPAVKKAKQNTENKLKKTVKSVNK